MMLKDVKEYHDDKQTFAQEILLYGRKSGKMLNNVKWSKKTMEEACNVG